jgi:hypothetical protein
MDQRIDRPAARRSFIVGASALAAGTLLAPAPAQAVGGRYAQSLRLAAEGEVPLTWVLSLLPLTPPPFPIVARARFQFPTPVPAYGGKDVMSIFIYAVPAIADPNLPQAIPISAFHAAIENVALDSAPDGGDRNPSHNLVMSGRVAGVEVPSPFGDLTGRTFAFGCGFTWTDDRRSAAMFKLLAGTVAGSHVTVLPEAVGAIETKRPWQSY